MTSQPRIVHGRHRVPFASRVAQFCIITTIFVRGITAEGRVDAGRHLNEKTHGLRTNITVHRTVANGYKNLEARLQPGENLLVSIGSVAGKLWESLSSMMRKPAEDDETNNAPTSVTLDLENEKVDPPKGNHRFRRHFSDMLAARHLADVRSLTNKSRRIRSEHGVEQMLYRRAVVADPSPSNDEPDLSMADEERGLEEEENHAQKVWNVMKDVRRHKHKTPSRTSRKHFGVVAFFESAVFYEWMLFAMSLMAFFPLFAHLQEWPHTRQYHACALLIWIAVAAVYNTAVVARLGRSAGVMWFTGYLLEFIFSIENVFVFHIVIKAFRAPTKLAQKAVFCVICCQIVFEMVFFMGLARQVRSMKILPYILGAWLCYVGYHAGKDDDHEDFDIKESVIFRLSNHFFGKRLLQTYTDDGAIFFVSGGRICVSLLFPLICCLMAVDFILEVDVTLTKIEELPNEYISFTSSALAAFAVPELFFVARDLFQRYGLLKYGVSFVLVFFGTQMLFHRFFDLPDLVGCAIIIMVMLICVYLSEEVDVDSDGQNGSPPFNCKASPPLSFNSPVCKSRCNSYGSLGLLPDVRMPTDGKDDQCSTFQEPPISAS